MFASPSDTGKTKGAKSQQANCNHASHSRQPDGYSVTLHPKSSHAALTNRPRTGREMDKA